MSTAIPGISSFLNRIDFLSILLPGYVATVAYLIIFKPTIFLSTNTISFDVLSALIFVVAGPALGLTLREFQRDATAFYDGIRNRFNKKRAAEDKAFLSAFAIVRLKMTADEKSELDEALALYDFSSTAGVAFAGLAILAGINIGWLRFEWIILLGIAGLLFVGGYFQRDEVYTPLILHLTAKYPRFP